MLHSRAQARQTQRGETPHLPGVKHLVSGPIPLACHLPIGTSTRHRFDVSRLAALSSTNRATHWGKRVKCPNNGENHARTRHSTSNPAAKAAPTPAFGAPQVGRRPWFSSISRDRPHLANSRRGDHFDATRIVRLANVGWADCRGEAGRVLRKNLTVC